MAFFQFRWPGQKGQGGKASKPVRPVRAESIEAMRRRARHRLIGAALLVLLGVVGFPVLFDTQPRPIPVDISIEIPDRNKVAPLVVPAAVPTEPAPSVAPAAVRREPEAPSPTGVATGSNVLAKPASTPEVGAPVVATPAATRVEPRADARPKPAESTETRASPSDEAARARALLEGRSAGPAAAAAPSLPDKGRFIVQIGAFADAGKAREVRLKLERAGIKTYTHVIETPDGKRIRVRVGPFDGKAEAEKAAVRIKGLNLPVSILLL